jgi:hypothetical protein
MVNQDTDIVALMDIATLVHDTEYKTKQSFGESDPQRLNSIRENRKILRSDTNEVFIFDYNLSEIRFPQTHIARYKRSTR